MSDPLEVMSPDLLAAALENSNNVRLDRLAREGFPMNVLGCYVADLVDFLMPEATEERLAFDARWQHHLSVLLDEAETGVRKAKLTADQADAGAERLLDRALRHAKGN